MKSLIVCGENFVNDQNAYVVSSGDATKAYLYDQKPASKWLSSGSSDGVAETIEIDFQDRQGNAISRTFDRLIFLACNLTRFYAEYWNGAAWVVIADSVFDAGTPNASADVYVEMAASVSSTKLRITMTHTFGTGEKWLGELKACLFSVLVRHKVDFQRENWDDGGDFRLDGGKLVTFVSTTKLEGEVALDQVTLDTYEIMAPLVDAKIFMTWILWDDFRLADIYEVAATTPLKAVVDRQMSLYTLTFTVKER